MNPVHVVVTAQTDKVPGDLVILAHGQAWQITKQVAIDSWRRRKESGLQHVDVNSWRSLLAPSQQKTHDSTSHGVN